MTGSGTIELSSDSGDIENGESRDRTSDPASSEAAGEPGALALAGFSSPAFALTALGLPISAILPPLYAELGLGLTAVGAVFMVTRIFDGLTDPIFGVLGDRVKTRWGRRRPAIVLSLPVLMVGVYLVFMPQHPVTEARLLVALIVLYVGWTVYSIAHTAWASELSTNYDGRSRVMGYLQFAGLLGTVGVMLVPLVVDLYVPDATMAIRGVWMGWLIVFMLPLLTLVALASRGEARIDDPRLPPWRDAWQIFRGSPALRRLLLTDLLIGVQGGINGSLHFFFVIHVLELPTSASIFLLAIFVTGVVFIPPFVALSYRLNKHRTLCAAALFSSFATACNYFVPAKSFWIALVVFIMIGVKYGSSGFLMRSMMADIVDEDRSRFGTERSALFYSILTLTPKLGSAIAVAVTYALLEWVGFDPAAENSPEVLEGVRLIVATSPTLVTIAIAGIMWSYPLDRTTQRELRTRIEER